jgi:hypothetical protein
MRRFALVLLLLCLSCAAQQTPAAPQQAQPPAAEERPSREDILRLFKAVRLETNLEQVQTAVMSSFEEIMRQTVEERVPTMTAEQRAKVDAYYARNRERSKKLYPIPEMMEDFVPLYQKHFSKADVEAVIAFYGSPIGQRLLDSQPELMREGMAMVMPKLQQRLKEAEEEIKRDAEETFAPPAKKREPTPAPPKKSS